MCLACRRAFGPLCPPCRATLRAVSPTVTAGVVAAAPFRHDDAARHLVHRVKYEGSVPAARLLVRAMAPLIPEAAESLVPVPRVASRRYRFGVDGALLLAEELALVSDLPLVRALRSPTWYPRHAGRPRRSRRSPRFEAIRVPSRPVIVDDVFTTGATARAALAALPTAIGVMTATRAEGTSLFTRP